MQINQPYLLVGGGQYANRGCEAYSTSSMRIIRSKYPENPLLYINSSAEYDQPDEQIPNVTHIHKPISTSYPNRTTVSSKIFRTTGIIYDLTRLGGIVKTKAPECKAVISLGADLYGLSWGADTLFSFLMFGEQALKSGKPFVIWSSTIGKFEENPTLKKLAIEQFKRVKLLLVREQDSFDYLSSLGIKENVKLVADPAFTMEPIKPAFEIPLKNPLSESIGFNLTATYGHFGKLGSYRDMIKIGADIVEKIIEHNKRPVVLVPHVMAYPPTTFDNDTLFLALIREELAIRGIYVDQLPSRLRAWEVKWVISQLYCYIGSRWHSTIASLGTATPTLSITFSEKGKALNNFMFGHANYTLSCSDIITDKIFEKLDLVIQDREDIIKQLNQRLPDVKELSAKAGLYLKEVMGD